MANLRAAAFALCATGLLLASPLLAKKEKEPEPAPKIFQDVVDCRKIAADAERLACYDGKVAALEAAQQSNELYLADKEQMKDARKGLFGFTLPKIKIFGNGDDEKQEINEIEAEIASVSQGKSGWVFTLKDGAVWEQKDQTYLGRSPKPGQMIKIKRGPVGNYWASVAGGVGFRAARRP
jgi:hypothetical protein